MMVTATKTSLKNWVCAASDFSKGLCQSSGKEKQNRSLVITSSTKHEIRQCHIVVVPQRQRNVQKSVMLSRVVVLPI